MRPLAEGLLRFKYPLLALWLLLLGTALGLLLLRGQPLVQSPISGARGTEAWQVEAILEKDFGFDPDLSAGVVLSGPAQARTGPQAEAFASEMQAAFPESIGRIFQVPGRGEHRQTLFFLQYHPHLNLVKAQQKVPEMRSFLQHWAQKHQSQAWLTGHVGFIHDMNKAVYKESSANEKIAIGLAFLILVLNFGGIFAALLPILMGAATLVFLNALTPLLGMQLSPISFVMNSMVGLALALDYSLFMVSRFREEIRKGQSDTEALQQTLKHSGETILFSALIMLVSIGVLLLPDVSANRLVVQGLSLVICLSLLNSLVFLPVLLLTARPVLEFPRFLSQAVARIDSYPFWRRFSGHVVKYPLRYFLLSLGLMGALALPALQIRLWEPLQAVVPTQSESVQGYEALRKDGWGGELLPIDVVLSAPPGKTVFDPAFQAEMETALKQLEALPGVASLAALTRWNPDYSPAEYQSFFQSLDALSGLGLLPAEHPVFRLLNPARTRTLVQVYPSKDLDIQQIYTVLAGIRAQAGHYTGLKIQAGGVVARSQDFSHELYRHAPLMTLGVVLGILLILGLYMKTPVLPLKAALMNFMPILGAFGVLVLVFQHGWFSGLLHTPTPGAVTALVPIILFCITFGLSMDYEVLILSRISEGYHAHGDVSEAVVEGLARSGAVITGAALILLGVFLPGIFSASPLVQELSIGISAALILDATVLRLFLVPSFMLLLGKYNWWNPWARGK
jgi:RND superfamily putative drug exporter